LWRAFGWDMPEYAHLPVLLNPNGKGKLSKRHAGFSEDGRQVLVLVHEFKEAGYLPEAVINFLCNIGWNFGDDREIFTVQQAIERFDLKDVHPQNSSYPIEKLDWLNGEYIRAMSPDNLAPLLRAPLEHAGLKVDDARLHQVAPLVQIRLKTLNDVVDLAGFFFHEEFQPAPLEQIIQKNMDATSTRVALEQIRAVLAALPTFDHQTTHDAVRALSEQIGVKHNLLFSILRVTITGQTVSTPLFETMEILGRDESIRRIDDTIQRLA
jgi:glutamyl-tRNA synthetase